MTDGGGAKPVALERVQSGGLQEEARLVARAREGDRDAFWELAEPELPKLHRLLVRMTGREAEAEDLCQESLLKAWRAVPSFQAQSRFGTWLYRIAVNTALSAAESRREIAASPE